MPRRRPHGHGPPNTRRRTRHPRRPADGRVSGIGWAIPLLLLGVALALLILPGLAVAAPGSGAEAQPIPAGSDGPAAVSEGVGGSLLRLGLGLVVVLGLIAAIWYVLRRLQRSRYPGDDRVDTLVRVISTTALGPNRAIHVIEVAGELMLVGAGEGAITPLARLSTDPGGELLDVTIGGRGAVELTGHAAPLDDRARAVATSASDSVVDRLRALTVRR